MIAVDSDGRKGQGSIKRSDVDQLAIRAILSSERHVIQRGWVKARYMALDGGFNPPRSRGYFVLDGFEDSLRNRLDRYFNAAQGFTLRAHKREKKKEGEKERMQDDRLDTAETLSRGR